MKKTFDNLLDKLFAEGCIDGHGEQIVNEWLKDIEQQAETVSAVETIVSGQNYTKVWELLKEARDEADAEGLERVSSGIETLLELISHRCTKHR